MLDVVTQEQLNRASERISARKAINDKKIEGLFLSIKSHITEIESLLARFDEKYEDGVYRFYHHSFKVYFLQDYTQDAIKLFTKIREENHLEFFEPFEKIIEEGTGIEFELDHNRQWSKYTIPILDAFGHCHYFLKMMVKFGKYSEIPEVLPSGYAAILCLYQLR